MNVFEVKQTYLGEVNEEAMNDAFAEFMNLAKAIRERLGAHKYLLEQYLLGLLHAVSSIPCIDTASDAENFSSYCRRIYRQTMRGDTPTVPLGHRMRSYMEAHPFASLKEHTRMEIYMTELFDFNLEYAIGQYQDYLDTCQSSFFDRNEIAELYRNIVRLLESESDMDRLNALLAQRFLLVKPIPLFIQAYTQDLLGSLLYRDPQSDRSVLQLLLDR